MFPTPTRAALAPTDRAARPTGRWATRRFSVGKPSVRPSLAPWMTWPEIL